MVRHRIHPLSCEILSINIKKKYRIESLEINILENLYRKDKIRFLMDQHLRVMDELEVLQWYIDLDIID